MLNKIKTMIAQLIDFLLDFLELLEQERPGKAERKSS